MKNKFSIEDIFHIVEMQNHAVGIHFTPGSNSFQHFRDGVTLLKITNFKLETILQNILNNTSTYGTITGRGYNHTPPPNKEPIFIEFQTSEIYEIEKYNA